LGRKVHPLGFRLGIIRDWQARWYADKPYAEFLQEDMRLRKAIQSSYPDAAISQTLVERQANEVFVTIYTARPGIVIGRGGQRVDETRNRLEQLIGKRVRLNIQEVAQPELDAFLVARTVADQIEHRIAYRRAMKQAIFRTTQAGAKGIKIICSGRLGGAEIARTENLHQGRVPLHTIRADIDYGFTEARTAMGRIGVKVWIYKGDILPERKEFEAEEAEAEGIGEGVVEVPAAEEAEPAPVVKKRAKATPAAEVPVEPAAAEAGAPSEPVATEAVEAPPAAEVGTTDVPVATEAVEASPEAGGKAPVDEEKPAKAKKTLVKAKAEKTSAEEEPAKPAAAKKTAAKAKAEETAAEEEPAKPKRRTKATATTDTETEESKAKPKKTQTTKAKSSKTEIEEKDATTQAGEIPEAS